MVIIKVNADGRITLLTGASDLGQGSNSTLAQIAAEVLGLSQDDITVIAADTAVTPFDHGSFGSRVTFNVGHTVKEAALDTRRQLVEAIAKTAEVGEEDIEIRDGQVYIKGKAEPAMSFAKALRMIQFADKLPITGSYRYYPPEYFAKLHPAVAPAFYVQAAEIEVDPETGRVRVLRMTNASDYGTPINPMRVEGQLEGCTQMGVGGALSEGFVLDEGQMMNASFLHYGFVTAADMPEVKHVPVEGAEPRGPFGAKEAGEGAVCSVAPAIIDALYDATGVWFKELPVTPEKVLKALEAKRRKKG
jgi:4-hydroxybenzoyl-CoA reductase subunit alpha